MATGFRTEIAGNGGGAWVRARRRRGARAPSAWGSGRAWSPHRSGPRVGSAHLGPHRHWAAAILHAGGGAHAVRDAHHVGRAKILLPRSYRRRVAVLAVRAELRGRLRT